MSAQLESQPKPVAYQDYSLDRKAEVLALVEANGGNVLQTARETGIAFQTIQYWQANASRFTELRQEKLVDIGEKLEKTVHKLIDSVHDHDLSATPLGQKATAFGIVFDKLQLHRGLPTSINAEVERQELVLILQSALDAVPEDDPIDVTPAPTEPVSLTAQISE